MGIVQPYHNFTGGGGGGGLTANDVQALNQGHPINREDAIEDVAPSAAEFPNPGNGDAATVWLENGIVEIWEHNGAAWAKDSSFNLGGGTGSVTEVIFRANTTQNVAPTVGEFAAPTTTSRAIVNLNGEIIEYWSFATSAWVRESSYTAGATRPRVVSAAIADVQDGEHIIVQNAAAPVTITIPVATKFFRVSRDSLSTADVTVVSAGAPGVTIAGDAAGAVLNAPAGDVHFVEDPGNANNYIVAVPESAGGGGGDLLSANNLSDIANPDAALTNLGGLTAGIQAFKANLARDLRAITDASLVISQMDGADFAARWADALSRLNAAGGGTLIIDENGSIDAPLANITPAHDNINIVGLHKNITITANSPIVRFFQVTGDNVSIRCLRFAMNGNTTSNAIQHTGNNLLLSEVEIFNTDPTIAAFGVNLAGGTGFTLVDSYIHTLGNCVVIGSGASRVRLLDSRLDNFGIRGVWGNGHATLVSSDIVISGIKNDVGAVGGQPIAFQNPPAAATARFNGVIIDNVKINDETSEVGAADSISMHAVRHFIVANCTVRRRSDVGINASIGCSEGLIVGCYCYFTDTTGVNIGVDGDVRRCSKITVVGCHMVECGRDADDVHARCAPYGVRDADSIRFISNTYDSGAGANAPDYEFYTTDSTDIAYVDNVGDDAYKTSRIGADGVNSFRKIDGDYPGEPPMIAGAPAGPIIYDSVASAPKMWAGALWVSLGGRTVWKAQFSATGNVQAGSNENITGNAVLANTNEFTITLDVALPDVNLPILATPNTTAAREVSVVVLNTTTIVVRTFTAGGADQATSFNLFIST